MACSTWHIQFSFSPDKKVEPVQAIHIAQHICSVYSSMTLAWYLPCPLFTTQYLCIYTCGACQLNKPDSLSYFTTIVSCDSTASHSCTHIVVFVVSFVMKCQNMCNVVLFQILFLTTCRH